MINDEKVVEFEGQECEDVVQACETDDEKVIEAEDEEALEPKTLREPGQPSKKERETSTAFST